jgi:hypothetical protein
MRRSLRVEVKNLKLIEIDVKIDPNIKDEHDEPEDYTTSPTQSPIKHKKQSIGKMVAKGKKKRKKKETISKYPKRNSTRVSNKFRLNSKALFHPSIKNENLIIIERYYEGR